MVKQLNGDFVFWHNSLESSDGFWFRMIEHTKMEINHLLYRKKIQ